MVLEALNEVFDNDDEAQVGHDGIYDLPAVRAIALDTSSSQAGGTIYGNNGVSEKGIKIPIDQLQQYFQTLKQEDKGFQNEFEVTL